MKSIVQIAVASPEYSQEIARVLKETFEPFKELYTPKVFDAMILYSERVGKRFNENGTIWVALENGKVIGTVPLSPKAESYVRSTAFVSTVQRGESGENCSRRLRAHF